MKQIAVALDARRLVRRTSGIAQYVRELSRWIPRLAPEFDVHLLVDRQLAPDMLEPGCRQAVLGRWFSETRELARAYAPVWMNAVVPKYLAAAGISLFHGTNYAVPALCSSRRVATIHDLSFMTVPESYRGLYRCYMRAQVMLAARRSDALVTVSESARRDMESLLGIARDRVVAIHNGVGSEFRRDMPQHYLDGVRDALGLPETYVLHVGVVESKKNLLTLIRATVPALEEGLADALVLAGRDGLGAADIKAEAERLRVRKKIIFLGHVDGLLLPGLYRLASAVVFPSAYEGFGLPVIEAMACGIPVIASNSSSLPEVVGPAGLLIDPRDESGLTKSLGRLLASPDLRESLAARGLSRAARFSWRASAEAHVSVYRRVLGMDRAEDTESAAQSPERTRQQ